MMTSRKGPNFVHSKFSLYDFSAYSGRFNGVNHQIESIKT